MGTIKLPSDYRYSWLVCWPSSRVSIHHPRLKYPTNEPRPQYSADWGDYISFAERMREKADKDGVDLLLVDCGDRVEGNGLYDASNPKGNYTYDIIREQHIDVLTTGNHELYHQDTAAREYDQTVPNFHGNYLASNLDYLNPKTGERVPMAQRYRKFTTKNQGIRILAMGFLYDFIINANNTFVQPVVQTIQEEWFQRAINEDVDLFLVAGHVTLNGPEYKAIYEAIRQQNSDTPIQFFGGHSHIRDFTKYDSKAFGFQAGRYMETIGWMSIDGISVKGKEDKSNGAAVPPTEMSFQRRYIDNNLFGYHHHTGLNETTFPTEHGRNVSSAIHSARKAMNLDYSFGCAPRDLFVNRAPYPSENSLLTWLENEVMPDVAFKKDRKDVPRLAITNTGAMRFDIFKGAFTKDTTYIISPFVSKLRYIKDVPYKSAKGVIQRLNSGENILNTEGMKTSQLAPPEQMANQFAADYGLDVEDSTHSGNVQAPFTSKKPELVPGHTTRDSGGDDGDDTVHSPIEVYRIPNCVQSEIAFPSAGEPATVDVVFVDFIQPWILAALTLEGQRYDSSNTESYTNESLTELIAGWIKRNWKKDC